MTGERDFPEVRIVTEEGDTWADWEHR